MSNYPNFVYKLVDRWHVITSPDVPGLYIASTDISAAISDIGTAVRTLRELNAVSELEAAIAAAAVAAERERLKGVALSRARHEIAGAAAAAAAGKWHVAHEYHTTRYAAMSDMIDAVFGRST
jgi:hypothetical protein